MKIQEKIESLFFYYESTRRAGHTTAMLNGARNTKKVSLLVVDQRYADFLKREIRHANFVTLNSLTTRLVGTKMPLLIDNGALWSLLGETLREFYRLEKENADLRRKKNHD